MLRLAVLYTPPAYCKKNHRTCSQSYNQIQKIISYIIL